MGTVCEWQRNVILLRLNGQKKPKTCIACTHAKQKCLFKWEENSKRKRGPDDDSSSEIKRVILEGDFVAYTQASSIALGQIAKSIANLNDLLRANISSSNEKFEHLAARISEANARMDERLD